MAAAPNLIFVALRHPLQNRRGDATFVRAHARAAYEAGFRPWVLFAHPQPVVEELPFATFEGVRPAGIQWVRRMRPAASIVAAMFAGALAPRAAARAAGSSGPIVVHGIGVAAHGAVLAARLLTGQGRQAAAIASCYTSLAHEYQAKLVARGSIYGWAQRLRAALELRWVRRFVAPREASGYEGSSYVLVNYRAVEREVHRRWPRARCRLLPYASEQAFLDGERGGQTPSRARTAPSEVAEIVTVAWHDPRKGWDVLLPALALLRDRGVPFATRLVGGGPLLAAHRRLAQRLRLEGLVRFEADAAESFPRLRGAAIFVLASRQEGSGSMALLEAMQAGLAPVVSAVDGLVEDVEHETNGLLVPPGDPAALAEALARLLRDEALRLRLARAARRTFERRFSAAGLVGALAEVYIEAGLRPAGEPLQRAVVVPR